MRRKYKNLFTILIIMLLCITCLCLNKKEANADNTDKYMVLIQQKNGFWKEYTNLIETSDNGFLMIKVNQLSKALGFTYKNNSNGTFVIKKSSTIYNTYTKNNKNFTYINGGVVTKKTAPNKAYQSIHSGYNLCQISTMSTLVNYKYFSNSKEKETSSYHGIICFSKYNDIPDSVPVLIPSQEPTPTPYTEVSPVIIEGVEFPVRTNFLAADKTFSDWGGTAIIWSELEHEVDSKIIESTNLCIDSNKIEFTHLGLGSDGVSLTKTKKSYQLSISVKLEGSVIADQNASIVKAMVATISSKPSLVYEAIFKSFTTNETQGINENTYVTIGDCKMKVKIKDGIVTYYIRENK